MKRLTEPETKALLDSIQKASPFDQPAFAKMLNEMKQKMEKSEQRRNNKAKKGQPAE